MAESTLSSDYLELRRQIGMNMGFGRGASPEPVYTDRKLQQIDDMIKHGCRRAYRECGTWAWMTPRATLVVLEGDNAVDLPDDFGGLDNPITVGVPGVTSGHTQVQTFNAAYLIHKLQTGGDHTGRPIICADSPKKDVTAGQRWELLLYPTANQDYTIHYGYKIIPEVMSLDEQYSRGGPEFSGLILAASLAAVELHVYGRIADFEMNFQKKLADLKQADLSFRNRNGGMMTDPGSPRYRQTGFRWQHDAADPQYVP